MGKVLKFRRARLSGFIPDDLGDRWAEKHRSRTIREIINELSADGRARATEELIEFAKRGAPPDPDIA